LATSYFDDEVGINKIIQIEGLSFRVVGILEDGTRNEIYMPISLAYNVIEDSERGEYNSIQVKLEDDSVLNESIAAIEHKLEMSRHAMGDDKDFTVSDPTQMASMASDMTSTISTVLTAIAAISLLVGAIGVANSMFTSVLEKTKQIGIMKAIGAKNKDILTMFVFNSIIIGLIGGLLGLGLGIFISELGAMALGFDSIIGINTIMIAVFVSIGTGLIAGIIPAYQASKLKPVDALRFE
jgi:putative ABC transport system permease protein